jgi:hypothetical protein
MIVDLSVHFSVKGLRSRDIYLGQSGSANQIL